MRVNAVIVAAGEGRRMGANVPKAFLPLAGRPLILHALSRFAASRVRKAVLVAAEADISRCRELIRQDLQLGSLEFVFQAGGLRGSEEHTSELQSPLNL